MNKSFALGRLPVGTMNKTEAAYASHLDLRRQVGEILWYLFEGIKLRLADNTFYSPDFIVMRSGGMIECHEVKGTTSKNGRKSAYFQDDSKVKIKVAAGGFPFRFIVAYRVNGNWIEEEV